MRNKAPHVNFARHGLGNEGLAVFFEFGDLGLDVGDKAVDLGGFLVEEVDYFFLLI